MTIAGGDPPFRSARSIDLLNHAEQIGGLGSWEWAPDAADLRWSDNLFRLLGLEPGAIVPSVDFVLARVHPDDRPRVEDATRAIAAGEFKQVEYRVSRTDGAVRHLRVEVARFEARPSVPGRIVGSVQDLTLQRHSDRRHEARDATTRALEDWTASGRGARRLVGCLAVALDVPFGAFWVPDASSLVARAIWHLPSPALAGVLDATRDWRPGGGSPSVSRAFAGREPVILADPSKGGSPARRAAIRRAGLNGAVAIAAVSGPETLAVLEFLSAEPIDPSEPLLRVLRGIGHEIGHFLSRRRGELCAAVLTPREREVLQLAADGGSTVTIAAALFLSPATVKRHLESAYARLEVSDRVAAVGEAMRRGLIA